MLHYHTLCFESIFVLPEYALHKNKCVNNLKAYNLKYSMYLNIGKIIEHTIYNAIFFFTTSDGRHMLPHLRLIEQATKLNVH